MAAKTVRVKKPRAERPHVPGYIDPEDKKGLLPWKWAVDRLTKTQNYFLATVREDGRPHVMPIWGIWIANRFYFSTGTNSVKGRNLAANPRCVLCPGGADEAVVLEGKAAKVTDKALLKKFNTAYKKKYNYDIAAMNQPIFSIRPTVAFGQIEKTFTRTATRWTF
jgi:nitroimidazol reductase NimA-like FMN-containing flavoprotein (pyridoxamine 5'-phosphate oxidase superfamily)